MTTANRTEHAEQVELMRLVKMSEGKYPALKLMFACPNGSLRHHAVAAKLKAEGVKPGVPDLMLPVPIGGYTGLAIEMKSMTGYASREQKDWIEALRSNGWRAEVCRGREAAWKVVLEYVEASA
jgi:hypothetical protein